MNRVFDYKMFHTFLEFEFNLMMLVGRIVQPIGHKIILDERKRKCQFRDQSFLNKLR